jgi:hypothetical protein
MQIMDCGTGWLSIELTKSIKIRVSIHLPDRHTQTHHSLYTPLPIKMSTHNHTPGASAVGAQPTCQRRQESAQGSGQSSVVIPGKADSPEFKASDSASPLQRLPDPQAGEAIINRQAFDPAQPFHGWCFIV